MYDNHPVGTILYWLENRRVPIGWEPALEVERNMLPPAPPGLQRLVPIVKIFHARPQRD